MSVTTESVINAVNFDPTVDVKYAKPKINKSGGKGVKIMSANSNASLTLQTPKMLTWGVSEFVDEKSGKCTYDLALQFPRDDWRTDATDKFLAAMIAFQDKIKADAIANSKEWMNKPKMSPEVIDALFHPMLKYSKDPKTGEPDYTKTPTLKVKVDHWNDAFKCEIYDTAGQLLFSGDNNNGTSPMELIPKGMNIEVVLQCGGIWFANGKFGVTWKLHQAMIHPKPSMKGVCLFPVAVAATTTASTTAAATVSTISKPIVSTVTPVSNSGMEIVDDSDEDDEGITEVPIPAVAVAVAVPQAVAVQNEDADDDETDEAVATPNPTPFAAPVNSVATSNEPAKKKQAIVRKVKVEKS